MRQPAPLTSLLSQIGPKTAGQAPRDDKLDAMAGQSRQSGSPLLQANVSVTNLLRVPPSEMAVKTGGTRRFTRFKPGYRMVREKFRFRRLDQSSPHTHSLMEGQHKSGEQRAFVRIDHRKTNDSITLDGDPCTLVAFDHRSNGRRCYAHLGQFGVRQHVLGYRSPNMENSPDITGFGWSDLYAHRAL